MKFSHPQFRVDWVGGRHVAVCVMQGLHTSIATPYEQADRFTHYNSFVPLPHMLPGWPEGVRIAPVAWRKRLCDEALKAEALSVCRAVWPELEFPGGVCDHGSYFCREREEVPA